MNPILESLRDQWPVERVLSEYGHDVGRGHLANCPFCYDQQTTPAATFSYTTSVWYCHRCTRKGNSFSLVMQLFEVDFKEAVRRLAGGDPFKDLKVRRHLSNGAGRITRQGIFNWKDETNERDSFLTLERMIGKDLKRELAAIAARERMMVLDHDDAEGERIVVRALARRLWDELDRVRCLMFYWLRTQIHGGEPWEMERDRIRARAIARRKSQSTSPTAPRASAFTKTSHT